MRLMRRFRGGPRPFVIGAALLVVEALAAVVEPIPIAYLIDYLQGGAPDLRGVGWLELSWPARTQTLIGLTAGIILLAAVNSAADSLAEVCLARGGRVLGYDLRVGMYSHLQRLSLAYHDRRRTGDVLTRVTGDVLVIEDFVVKSVSNLLGSLLVLIGSFAVLLWQSWRVALIALFIVPLLALASTHFSRRLKTVAQRQRASEGDLASTTQEMLTSIRLVQSYGRGSVDLRRFSDQTDTSMRAAVGMANVQAQFSFVIALLEALAVCAIVWIGVLLVDASAISVGTLVFFILVVRNMFKPSRKIVSEWYKIGKVVASVDRIVDLLDLEPEVRDSPDAIPAPPLAGRLALHDVTFAYPYDARGGPRGEPLPVLRHVDFEVRPGEVVALAGRSGAGKSTIAQLVPRLYDPSSGAVLVDEVDVRYYTLETLRAQVSLVLQDTVLLSGTVAENIGYGVEGATQREIEAAARSANAHDFIECLPQGYDTVLGERGSTLSGGERQRIAIARAFIRRAPILVLDEPTTGLDADSTRLVVAALRNLVRDTTTIIISHDAALLGCADRILVVRDGRIAEELTPRETAVDSPARGSDAGRRDHGSGAGPEGASDSDRDGEPAQPHPAQPHPQPEQDRPDETDRIPTTSVDEGRSDVQVAAKRRRRLWRKRAPVPDTPAPTQRPPRTVGELVALRAREAAEREAAERAAADRETAEGVAPEREAGTPRIATAASALAGLSLAEVAARRITLLRVALGEERAGVEARAWASGSASGADVEAVRVGSVLCRPDVSVTLRYHVRTAGPREQTLLVEVPPDGRDLVVRPFPDDPGLPTLPQAVDPAIARTVLAGAVPGADSAERCDVEVVHHPRTGPCVLRYSMPGHHTVFGKVYPDAGGAERAAAAMRLLRAELPPLLYGNRILVPEPLAVDPSLRLGLAEAIPGRPLLAGLLRAALTGEPAAGDHRWTLRGAVEMAARVAASVHRCETDPGQPLPVRDIDGERTAVEEELRKVGEVWPLAVSLLRSGMSVAAGPREVGREAATVLAHGDMTPAQLLLARGSVGLVDVDTLCRAEPALDLGRFLAYLHVAGIRCAGSTAWPLLEALSASFLHAYVDATRYWAGAPTAEGVIGRVAAFRTLTLGRMGARACRQLKDDRLRAVVDVLGVGDRWLRNVPG
jgi:ABC-type multidrug transport system fused ATPase/permease subunit